MRAVRGMRAIGKYKFLKIFLLEIVCFVIGNVLSIANMLNRDGSRGGHVILDANSLGRGRATNFDFLSPLR